MRQGYHPLEIQRLAGHTSLKAQVGYYSHLEYWVDVEIVELVEQVRTTLDLENLQHIDEDFKGNYVRNPGIENSISLDIGYCLEPNQLCPVEECFECEFWKISDKDFLENIDVIQEKLSQSKEKINELLVVLTNLQKIVFRYIDNQYDLSENDYAYNRDLKSIKQQLDLAIRKHSYIQSKWRN